LRSLLSFLPLPRIVDSAYPCFFIHHRKSKSSPVSLVASHLPSLFGTPLQPSFSPLRPGRILGVLEYAGSSFYCLVQKLKKSESHSRYVRLDNAVCKWGFISTVLSSYMDSVVICSTSSYLCLRCY
ncbi:MAG: hypothetical protein QW279_15605, partial [Candidatus Jordarchaeaceae archaeon]